MTHGLQCPDHKLLLVYSPDMRVSSCPWPGCNYVIPDVERALNTSNDYVRYAIDQMKHQMNLPRVLHSGVSLSETWID